VGTCWREKSEERESKTRRKEKKRWVVLAKRQTGNRSAAENRNQAMLFNISEWGKKRGLNDFVRRAAERTRGVEEIDLDAESKGGGLEKETVRGTKTYFKIDPQDQKSRLQPGWRQAKDDLTTISPGERKERNSRHHIRTTPAQNEKDRKARARKPGSIAEPPGKRHLQQTCVMGCNKNINELVMRDLESSNAQIKENDSWSKPRSLSPVAGHLSSTKNRKRSSRNEKCEISGD